MTMEPTTRTPRRGPAIELSIILAVCVVVYWIGLGSTGLSLSEGLRAIPAWEMMDSGDYFVTRMFGEAYFRKPPGMMWAIAASSSIFGQTEFAARAVSAAACTAMALAAWWFARRWFGHASGLAAGLAQGLSPFLWEAGRSAEIEALHTLFIQLACLCVLDPAIRADRSPTAGRWLTALMVLGILGALLTKGPAGLPAVAGAVLASVWLVRSSRFACLRVAATPMLAVAIISSVLFPLLARSYAAIPTVTQSPGEFLWDTSKLASILLLPLVGLAAALPGSLAVVALPSLWARRSTDARVDARVSALVAIIVAALVSLAIFTVAGVSNPRYTMPVVPFWPVALGGLIAVTSTVSNVRRFRTAIVALTVLLVVAGVTITQLSDRARSGDGGRGSGKPTGQAIAAALVSVREASIPGSGKAVELWADGAVEARPEVLLYARRAAASEGFELRPRWSSALLRPFCPPDDAFVLVRVEGTLVEGGDAVSQSRPVVWEGRVAKFSLRLLGPRTAPPP